MADEVIVTPVVEEITTPAEGSMASIEVTPEAPKVEETVSLATFLEVKNELKDIKKQMKENLPTKAELKATVKAVADKYPDVSEDFIRDIVNASKQEAIAETEAKYTPLIERQANEKKQEQFDKAFDSIFNKALADNPGAENVDKDVIKTLALTPQYNNTPVAELIQKLYPTGTIGKATTENDMRAAPDVAVDKIDLDTITPEQRTAILADPKTRKEYYDKMDSRGR